jgi:excisionase family DNA binding protein
MASSDFLTTTQAALKLGVVPETVAKMVRDGRLRGVVIPGPKRSIIKVDPSSVKEYRQGLNHGE